MERVEVREARASSRGVWRTPNLVAGIAAIAAVAGVVLAIGLATAEPVVTAGTEARSGDLSLWVSSSEWLEHDHSAHDHGDGGDGGDDHGDGVDPNEVPVSNVTDVVQGFQMPGSMMPGTPDEGSQRLQINVSLTNQGNTTSVVEPADFVLVGANDATWDPLEGGTFVPMEVPPAHAFSTVLAFDVPSAEINEDLYVEWTSSGQKTRLAIAELEGHDHG
ncbi:MAG: hypothetical protein WBV89_12195 [Ilumatobacter sp.]